MKNLGKLIIATIAATASISCGAFAPKPAWLPTATINDRATIMVDQSFISDTNMGAEINSGFLYTAQTFTAQTDGILAGVSLDVTASSIGNYPLHVAIRTVDADGKPGLTILGETTLDSRSAPLTRVISFPQTIAIRAGDHYAIVVNYEGGAEVKGKPLGSWQGVAGNRYPGGEPFESESDGLTWTTSVDGDFHFQTFIIPGPIANERLSEPTKTVSPSGPVISSKIHLSVSTKGLTDEKDQLALWSGDNESHRFCFSECRDTSGFVHVKPDKITVREGFPITYDQWTLMLEIAPNSAYARNSLEVDILYKGESWFCINDLGGMGPQSDYLLVYVADIDPPNYNPPVVAMPPYFSCYGK